MIASLSVALALCTKAPEAPPAPDTQLAGHGFLLRPLLLEKLQRSARRGQLSGLVLGVHGPDGPKWSEAILPGGLRPQSPHRVGLVSGLFTTLAALSLQEQGRLKLSDPLRRWLPELQLEGESAQRPPTVGHLLDHSSGLPAQALSGQWSPQSPSSLLATPWPLLTPPGSSIRPGTLGHSLLGLVLERASGRPFTALMRESLLPSWGLPSARYPSLAPNQGPPCRDLAAQGLSLSAAELGHFLSRLHQRHPSAQALPLSQAALDGMLVAQHPTAHELQSGQGWMLESLGPLHREGLAIAHLGSSQWGQHAQVVHLPRQRTSIVVFGQGQGAKAREAVNDIAELLLAYVLDIERRVGEAEAPTAAPLRPGNFPPEEAQAWPGDWILPTGLTRLHAQGPAQVGIAGLPLALHAVEGGGAQLRLNAWGLLGWPLGSLSQLRLRPIQEEGRTRLVAQQHGVSLPLGEKLPEAPTHPAWQARAGSYRFVAGPQEVAALPSLQLEAHGDRMLLRLKLADPPESQQLLALGPHEAQHVPLLGAGFGAGESLHALPDGSLSAFGGRFTPTP